MAGRPLILLVLLGAISLGSGKPLIADVLKNIANTASNVLQFENVNNGEDGYAMKMETEDGTYREEKGEFVNGVWTVSGVYSYLSPDDKRHTVRYTADDNGFSPVESDDLPPGAMGRSPLSQKTKASLLG